MSRQEFLRGAAELRAARAESRGLFVAAFVFSIFVNLLMLTGPLYMLQVYDRVLGSRSEPTLLALTVLMAFMFLMMGVLDWLRTRVLVRIGARFQARLERRVFSAVLRRSGFPGNDAVGQTGLRDLEAVQRLIGSPVLVAMFDLPWTPFFLLGVFLFHPYLGILAVAGGIFLVIVTYLNQLRTRMPLAQANAASMTADHFSEQVKAEAELIQSLGMRGAAFERWQAVRSRALAQSIDASDRSGGFSILSKTFRQFLQSAMLGLAAWLVLQGLVTPGAMIASSILMGRALQPIEIAIGQWAIWQRGREGWSRLEELLARVPVDQPRTELPRPRAILEAQHLTVVPPGEQTASLRMISFRLEPGKAMGVIGPSGAGKSTLARALTGVWRPAGGTVRLDGATLDQYDPDVLGTLIGYLPQRVTLFDGTIAENIARLATRPDPEKVVAAAKRAAAHDMIVNLPEGYDTRVLGAGGRLSGGQIQRIGLARALYSDPVILVLDEPNSNLDNDGSAALNAAIRQMKSEGKSVLIMAHRPAAIQECDILMMLDGGMRRAYGPRDEVLRETVKNHAEIQKSTGTGGVT
ncbi:MAG: type I secretion system permease/ATPase [Paracoccaceae bacterium]